jgi:phosphatidylserine/phosphatidylglycerophosphate/cardiolipin synthase-like enzyme
MKALQFWNDGNIVITGNSASAAVRLFRSRWAIFQGRNGDIKEMQVSSFLCSQIAGPFTYIREVDPK